MISWRNFHWLVLPLITITASCSSGAHVMPKTSMVSGHGQATIAAHAARQLMPNLFASAQGKALTEADYDAYINTPLSPSDRALAHRLMAFMPPNQRGDFLALTSDGRVISNNSQLLASAKLTIDARRLQNVAASSARRSDGVRHVMDYSSSCSPPNPPSVAGGPYVRQVSLCGFASGWAFLNIPCGYTSLQSGESGNTYFELTGPGGSEVEGGLFTDDGQELQPYLRSTAVTTNNGYETLTGGTYRYSCDEQMMIVHGVTQNDGNTFTEIGDASAYNPQSVWVNETQVTLVDPAWLFGPLPADVWGQMQGTDNAGNPAPCPGCSISEVTTIAQNTSTYNDDGSYFGVDTSTATNEIQWIQVAFGNWGSDCESGTTLCTFLTSSDPTRYYGGPQNYPDDVISQSNFGVTGYGPYETTDGIWLLNEGSSSSLRRAAIALDEPLPPPPCTLDSYAMCSLNTRTYGQATCDIWTYNVHTGTYYWKAMYPPLHWVYATYRSSTMLGLATKTASYEQYGCQSSDSWSPSEPRVAYNDPNLP